MTRPALLLQLLTRLASLPDAEFERACRRLLDWDDSGYSQDWKAEADRAYADCVERKDWNRGRPHHGVPGRSIDGTPKKSG